MWVGSRATDVQVPLDSWAAVGPPWHASSSAPSLSSCCTPVGWWALSGAGCGSARLSPSGWCPGAWTPAPAWTRDAWAAWRALGPSASAFCSVPEKKKINTKNWWMTAWKESWASLCVTTHLSGQILLHVMPGNKDPAFEPPTLQL